MLIWGMDNGIALISKPPYGFYYMYGNDIYDMSIWMGVTVCSFNAATGCRSMGGLSASGWRYMRPVFAVQIREERGESEDCR